MSASTGLRVIFTRTLSTSRRTAASEYATCGVTLASTLPPVTPRHVRVDDRALAAALDGVGDHRVDVRLDVRLARRQRELRLPGDEDERLLQRATSCARSFARAASRLRPPTSTLPTLTPLAIVSLRLES